MFSFYLVRKILDVLNEFLRHLHFRFFRHLHDSISLDFTTDFDFEVSTEFLRVVQFDKFIESFRMFPCVHPSNCENIVRTSVA